MLTRQTRTVRISLMATTHDLHVPPSTPTNPFHVAQPRWSLGKIVSRCVFGGIVAPIRICGIVVCLLSATVLGKMAVLGLSPQDIERSPLPAWRRFLFMQPVALIARFVLFLVGFHYIKEEGKPDPRGNSSKLHGVF
jgi:hypothetical protein